ncbi:MAG: response regulator transcription factor [Bacteroidales bacterium]|nr:response regulator transcription factor [Bacteroidales bacterium]MBR5831969.1 response regulator transcription factor [Bacteroidales bacterium]
MSKILIVDDEQDLCEILQFNLESEGYEVDTANSAEEGLKKLNSQHMLILLDVMMEDMSGFQMANKIRKELNNDVPIIFLTAKDTENDMLTGFNVGGDDYITKPFSLKAVMARVKAVIKRSAKSATAAESIIDTFKYKSLQINYETKKVLVDNKEVQLTRKEYMILAFLTQSPQRFFTREQILSQVWDEDAYVIERSVDVHIARLRKKLGIIGENIINRTGFGYSFDNN